LAIRVSLAERLKYSASEGDAGLVAGLSGEPDEGDEKVPTY
jgi:hypothetical protein